MLLGKNLTVEPRMSLCRVHVYKLWCNCLCFSVFLFSIGLLILAKALDRETVDQYLLIVTASDGQPGGVKLQPSYNKYHKLALIFSSLQT